MTIKMLCSSDRKEDTVERKGIGEYERDDDRVKGKKGQYHLCRAPLSPLDVRSLYGHYLFRFSGPF